MTDTWFVLPDIGFGIEIVPRKPRGHNIAVMSPDNPNALEDAHKIAAAPDLIEALQAIVDGGVELSDEQRRLAMKALKRVHRA